MDGKVMSARQKAEAGLIAARPNRVEVPIELLADLVGAVEKYGNKRLKSTNAFEVAQTAVSAAQERGCLDCGEA